MDLSLSLFARHGGFCKPLSSLKEPAQCPLLWEALPASQHPPLCSCSPVFMLLKADFPPGVCSLVSLPHQTMDSQIGCCHPKTVRESPQTRLRLEGAGSSPGTLALELLCHLPGELGIRKVPGGDMEGPHHYPSHPDPEIPKPSLLDFRAKGQRGEERHHPLTLARGPPPIIDHTSVRSG